MTDDRDLRERFAALRKADRKRVPGYERLLLSARRDSHPRTRVVAAGLFVVVVATILCLSTRNPEAPAGGTAIPSIASWRAPTDFLLATPVRDLLRTVPDIGAIPSAAPPTAARRPITRSRLFDKEQYA